MHPSPEFPNIGEHRNQDSLFRLRDVSRALVQNFMELHEYPMFQLGLLCRSSRVLIRAMVWFVQPYFLISKSLITGYQMSKFIQMPYNYIYISIYYYIPMNDPLLNIWSGLKKAYSTARMLARARDFSDSRAEAPDVSVDIAQIPIFCWLNQHVLLVKSGYCKSQWLWVKSGSITIFAV